MLKMNNITKTFNSGTVDERVALDHLSLTLRDGDFVTVIGGNGAGKSTMQNAICGTWQPDEGSIELDGVNVSSLPEYKRARYLGRVYQDPMMGTSAGMEIEENLALAERRGRHHTLRPGIRRGEREDYRRRLRELGLGLEDRLTTKVGTLSGGQKTRVSLGKLLLSRPDIILLDLGLPDIDGVDIIKKVREWSSCPIIVISARTSEREKVLALDLGADDYITKPFGTSELLARIRTSLRHSNKMNTDSPMFIKPYHAKDLTIDFSKRLILLHEQEIHLTPIEYKIVACLAKNSGKVVTYSSIMSDVWGPYTDTDNKILRVNMANIRRKLETNPAEPTYIFTELGVGYRMKEDESE